MGNTQDATRVSDVAARVRSALERRIGADRYAVWFGRSFVVHVEPAVPVARRRRRAASGAKSVAMATADTGSGADRVVLRVGTGLTHEWLRRTFRVDAEHAVREVCGPAVEIAWEATLAVDDAGGAGAGETGPTAAPARAERPVRGGRGRRARGAARVDGVAADGGGEPQAGESCTGPGGGERTGRGLGELTGQGLGELTGQGLGELTGQGLGDLTGQGLAEFVVGPSNRLACGAVELVASRPGDVSPLVIHGPSGVGKTHLLDVVRERLRATHPGAAIVSLSAEQFTNGFLQSLHGSGLPGFRRTCRSADLLVIDDIQFLVGKRATLLEFQLTVDALHRRGRQMVFACDRELDALSGLGPDLLTRLRGGMNAPILAPDYEVRRGIVAALCARRSLDVPDEVVHYVASHMTRHARELIGAVNRLEATSLMLGVAVTAGMAEEALADLVRSSARSVRLADVERAVCAAFGIEPGSLQSSRRARTVSQPRMLAMFLARKHTHAALADIGRYFGRRSHSTVIAAQKAVGAWVSRRAPVVLAETEWDVEEAIRRVEDLLRAG